MIQPNLSRSWLGIHQLVDVCLRAQFLILVTVIMFHYYLLELKIKGSWSVEIIKIMFHYFLRGCIHQLVDVCRFKLIWIQNQVHL